MKTNNGAKIGWIVAIVAVWLGGLGGTASAALIAYEGFTNTATQTVGGLSGGTGWTSVWQGDAAGTVTTIAGGTFDITAPGSTNTGLQVSGNAATATPTNGTTAAYRSFPPVNSGTVYFSMLETRLNAGARVLGMSVWNATTEYPFFGKNSGQTNWSMSGPALYASGTLAATNVPALLVLRVDFNVLGTGSAFERQRLYVNPMPGAPEPGTADADSVATTTYNIPQLDRVSIAAGYSNATFTTTSIGKLDELRIGTTWADVVPPAPVDFSSWAKKIPIQFTGYDRAEALTNFPALVTLSTNMPGFSYADFLSGANADLRFTDATQTNQIFYEIEKWDTNGTSYVWVQVPQLTNNAGIYAFWGKSGQTVPAYTTNGATWGNGFAGVWHMAAPRMPRPMR